MVVGIPTLRAIFEEKYYEELQGGILEGLGRLFRGPVKLFAYPTLSRETGELETADKDRHQSEAGTPVRLPVREWLYRADPAVLAPSSSISIPAMC